MSRRVPLACFPAFLLALLPACGDVSTPSAPTPKPIFPPPKAAQPDTRPTGFEANDERQKEFEAEAVKAEAALKEQAARKDAEKKRIQKAFDDFRAAEKVNQDARKAEEEQDVDGLVLLKKTVQGNRWNQSWQHYNGGITGGVINRTGKKLKYVQIRFILYDQAGAQIGVAVGSIHDLEDGARWNFTAYPGAVYYASYKLSELTGF